MAPPKLVVATSVGQAKRTLGANALRILKRRDPAPAFTPPPSATPLKAEPGIYIIEEFQLVTLGGDLGVMPSPIASFTAPPHSTKKTYLKIKKIQKVEGTVTSSAVESSDTAAANALSNSIRNSTSNTHSRETFDYEMDGSMEAEASWGPGGASTSGSVQAQTSSTGVHDTFRQAADSAVDQQVAQSESRHSQQETSVSSTQSSETSTESVEEFVLSNTTDQAQNFFFHRISQERVTALCLTEARLGLANAATRRIEEFPLSQIDVMLEKAIVPEHRQALKDGLLQFLSTVYDYNDEPKTFVESVDRGGVPSLRIVKDLKTEIVVPRSDGRDRSFFVPGVAIQSEVRLLPTGQIAITRGVSA